MKTVFSSTSEVCHIFAQQSQAEGRAGNVFFQGDTIYSYGRHFAIAKFETLPSGAQVVLITTRKYSVSTSKHTSEVRHAVNHLPRLYVNDPAAPVRDNLEYLRGKFDGTLGQIAATKHKVRIANLSADISGYISSALAICTAYDMPIPAWCIMSDDVTKQAAAYAAAQIARNAELAAIREAAQLEHTKKLKKDFSAWKKGADIHTSNLYQFPVALRIVGDTVQTSHGARITIVDVKKSWIWQAVQAVKASKEERIFEGDTRPTLGIYRADKILANGDLIAGCHNIPFKELAKVAKIIYSDEVPK